MTLQRFKFEYVNNFCMDCNEIDKGMTFSELCINNFGLPLTFHVVWSTGQNLSNYHMLA